MELAEACYRFSPQIAVREAEPPREPGGKSTSAIFLEIGKCTNLYSENTLFLRLAVLVQRFGVVAQIGLADDVPTALAMARFGLKQKDKLPLEALFDYASPFKYDDAVHKKILGMIVTMRMLGLEKLDDFAKLATRQLASRFGSDGVELSMRIQKKSILAWPRFTPAEKIIEKVELHELAEFQSCTDLEPLLFILKSAADRAMARLRGRAQRVSTLHLLLDLEKGQREWKIELPVPQGSTSGLLPILRERLNHDFAKAPLEKSIVRVSLTVLETVPSHRGQRDLFQTTGDANEAWDALVGRLCQRLGKDKAFVANLAEDYLPERAWQRALEALDKLPTEIPPRPARVLKKPVPLHKEGIFLVPSMKRGTVPKKAPKKWRIAEWHGPERISVEWWMDPQLQGFNRDYYRLVTEGGDQLWVFSVPARGDYYLHGYFD
ncbi:MAG: hypothetical protein HY074_12210 [Deltaproteobacteria bacterium]|nr:hypothetical protein [Deltaproteobacteria bacterium]